MSYSFTVEAKDNVLIVIGQTAEVPDGKYSVNGHRDGNGTSFGVTAYEEDGKARSSASVFVKGA